MATSSTSLKNKICFNLNCREILARSRKGWRCRTGEFTELCDRCASLYEEGRFCENFHFSSLGWRCCKSCGKTPTPELSPPSSLILPQLSGSDELPWNLVPPSPFIYTTQSGIHQPVDAQSSSQHIASELHTTTHLAEGNYHDMLLNGGTKFLTSDMVGTSSCGQHNSNGKKEDLRIGSSPSKNSSNGHTMVSQNSLPPNTLVKKEYGGHKGVYHSGDANLCDIKPPANFRSKDQSLSRDLPRMIDQELKQNSEEPNYVVTPLFEKTLSASDAGRIGRLVLPKRCAEAHFPPISHSEGLPIKFQDLNGNEWVFQYRYWINNNSRMYVLEGVTPFLQSTQLQAGDIVTFGRIQPEGNLVIGIRKAPTSPLFDNGNGNQDSAKMTSSSKQAKTKRQASGGGSKKRVKGLCMETENLFNKLDLTLEEAQFLLRPPPNPAPVVVVIEGFGFEEYKEDGPIIGRPTIHATDKSGEKVQWVQCEECFKWRKIPAGEFMPSGWTCSMNTGDPRRCSCSATQELTTAEIEELLQRGNGGRQIDLNMQPEEEEEDE